jgi:hypothetical protein
MLANQPLPRKGRPIEVGNTRTSLEKCHHLEGKAAQESRRHFWWLSPSDKGQAFSQFNPL